MSISEQQGIKLLKQLREQAAFISCMSNSGMSLQTCTGRIYQMNERLGITHAVQIAQLNKGLVAMQQLIELYTLGCAEEIKGECDGE